MGTHPSIFLLTGNSIELSPQFPLPFSPVKKKRKTIESRDLIHMIYKFLCPKCGKKKEIIMSVLKYTDQGHYCDCGEELKRDPESFCCNYKSDCDGFFGKSNK